MVLPVGSIDYRLLQLCPERFATLLKLPIIPAKRGKIDNMQKALIYKLLLIVPSGTLVNVTIAAGGTSNCNTPSESVTGTGVMVLGLN